MKEWGWGTKDGVIFVEPWEQSSINLPEEVMETRTQEFKGPVIGRSTLYVIGGNGR